MHNILNLLNLIILVIFMKKYGFKILIIIFLIIL